MVAELEKSLGAKARLIEGGRGVFDVTVEGDLVFSKHQVGRFPKPGELSTLLKSE